MCPTHPLGTQALVHLCIPSISHCDCLLKSHKNGEIKQYLQGQNTFLHTDTTLFARIPTKLSVPRELLVCVNCAHPFHISFPRCSAPTKPNSLRIKAMSNSFLGQGLQQNAEKNI